MRYQIRGLNQGVNNVEDGIGMIRTADGALDETLNILHRMKELAVQAANDTNDAVDRHIIQLHHSTLQRLLQTILIY